MTTSNGAADPKNPVLPEGYTLHEGYPPLPEYLHLRAGSGLTPVSPEQGAAVPSGSWYGVYITAPSSSSSPSPPSTDGEQQGARTAVAMGRIIGDGAWYFLVADMATLPEHQRKGLGDAILKKLLARVKERAPKGRTLVSLLADPPGRKMYAKNGFKESMPEGLGMELLINVDGPKVVAEGM